MRLLVVEDERPLASFVARAMREAAYSVDIAERGEVALRMAREVAYDGILLDLRLPGLDGVDVCRELRSAEVQTPILMLTARSLLAQKVEGLDAGADDYLTKPFEVAELRARVRAMIRRYQNPARQLRLGGLELDSRRRRVRRNGVEISLTSKEFAVLEYLMMSAPETVTRTELVEHAWDLHFDSASNVLEVIVSRLRQKLAAAGSPKIIQSIRGVGYRLSSEL